MIYLVQSTPDYEGQLTHFATLEFEKAEAAAIKIMQGMNIDYLEIFAVPLEIINVHESEMPQWESMGVYRTFEPRDDIRTLTVEVVPGVWKSTSREPTLEELEDEQRKKVNPNRPDWLSPSSSSTTSWLPRMSNSLTSFEGCFKTFQD
jgi:hypothetical protein